MKDPFAFSISQELGTFKDTKTSLSLIYDPEKNSNISKGSNIPQSSLSLS